MNNRCSWPCARCLRVVRPEDCENKRCSVWQAWFLSSWDRIYRCGVQLRKEREGHNELEK